jgi:hypothetical protein
MGKRNPETFYCLKEKHVSRENSSLKVNETVIANPEDIVRTMQEWYGALPNTQVYTANEGPMRLYYNEIYIFPG